MFTNFEIDSILESMTLLVDSREQPTRRSQARLDIIGLPNRRVKLDAGDYSCEVLLPDGSVLDFSGRVSIERKMNIDELCMCFGKERGRFQREFDRARESGTRMYLLVEDANWEKIFNGKYRSRYNSTALVASILAWQVRYDIRLLFCKAETSGRLIREILYREVKEYLERQ